MKYFGTDGIRGVANQELTPLIAYKVGRYLGDSSKEKKNIVIGKDSRISCDMLEAALIAGITSAGGDVHKLSIVPTPTVCKLVPIIKGDYGIIISASHNPVLDNGIKIVGKNGIKINSELEKQIEEFIDGDDDAFNATAGRIGRVFNKTNVIDKYTESLVKTVKTTLSGIKVVVDCANGAASFVAMKVFNNFACEVIYINNEPNGLNINENCGSTSPQSLCEKVKETKADFGIALDGDADRIVCVDSDGNVVDGDILLYILTHKYIYDKKLEVPTIALTSMSNLGVINALKKNLEVDVIITDVGDKYVAQAINKNDLQIGGESSGHIILSDLSKSGDGLLVGLQIADYIAYSGIKLNHFRKTVETYPSRLTNVTVPDKDYILTHRNLIEEIKRVENILGETGRVLVRASGTESLIRVLIECEDENDCEQFSRSISDTIKSIGGDI